MPLFAWAEEGSAVKVETYGGLAHPALIWIEISVTLEENDG